MRSIKLSATHTSMWTIQSRYSDGGVPKARETATGLRVPGKKRDAKVHFKSEFRSESTQKEVDVVHLSDLVKSSSVVEPWSMFHHRIEREWF